MERSKKHILIVEDEMALSHALTIRLQQEGYAVTVASNGEEALQKVESHPFDLILLDIIMPRMDGLTLLEFLKKGTKPSALIPVIVFSNLSQKEEMDRAKELGATEYLVKANTPFPKMLKVIKLILSAE